MTDGHPNILNKVKNVDDKNKADNGHGNKTQ